MRHDSTLTYFAIESPVGKLTIGAINGAIAVVHFDLEHATSKHIDTDTLALFQEAERQFREYFAGTRRAFDLPLAPNGSEFQQRVWRALLEIPYGETRSYKDQAIAVGDLKAIRAVAHANGQNPIAIIIPCHRVIGADGSLTGYGGGLERKRKLLELEGALQPTLL
jgi:methylated-DNA-[protein]-cysteine S-methyltransferase